jgi:integral membrane protein (TIGR01906 family)
MERLRGTLASLVLGVAAALVIVALAILPFFNPVWFAFEQDRAQVSALTGYTPDGVRAATDAILGNLVLGPPRFDVEVGGQPVLDEQERGHMRDVRSVFGAFYLAASIGALVLIGAFVLTRGRSRTRARARLWRRLSTAGLVIAVATIAGGITGIVFFDQAFLLFHELFFPQGNFQFDPRTQRLVQLFPETLWVDTTIGVGGVVVVLALALAWLGRRRAAGIQARDTSAPSALSSIPFR